jgi:excisionase family DNA binding protein
MDSSVTEAQTPPPLAPRLYKVPTVAEILGVSVRFVWQLIHDGVLSPVKIGSRTLVRDDELARYIDEQTGPEAS